MDSDQESVDYQFGEYRLCGSRQVLYRGEQEIEVSTKLYYLLLVLVRRHGEVLSKDDLIEAAWPGQVVTDAALAKQMLRVRRLIDDQDRSQPYIETHRGVGYRFVAPVQAAAPVPMLESGKPTRFGLFSLAGVGLAIIIAAGSFWWFTGGRTSEDSPSQLAASESAKLDSVSLALLPAQDTDDWLTGGGLEYLAARLGQDASIQTFLIRPDAGLSGDSMRQAIEITTWEQVQYAATFAFRETPQGYRVEVLLRNDSEQIGRTDFEGMSLASVFADIDRWLRHEIALHSELAAIEEGFLEPVDAFALQSYLQGIRELQGRDDKATAMQYFQAAVNKDPDFLEAWTKLAATLMETGELQRAISMSETLLQRVDIQSRPTLAMELYRVIGLAHGRLKNDQQATEHLQRALSILPEGLDAPAHLSALGTLELHARMQGRLEEAERLGLERLNLTRENFPLPNSLADIHLSIAETLRASRDWEGMRDHIAQALGQYEQSGNINGMIRGFYLLNELNFMVNDLDDGVQVTHRAVDYLDRSTLVHEKAFYLQVSAQILNVRGYFERALDYAARLRELSTRSGNPMYLVISEFIKGHQLYVDQRFADALTHTRTMLARFDQDDALRAALPRTLMVAILVSARSEPPAATEELIRRFDREYSGQRDNDVNEFLRAEGHLAVRTRRVDEGLAMLQAARQNHLDRAEAHVAHYIGLEMLEVLLEYPNRPYRPMLSQLEGETSYDYLLWKLKAGFLAREGDYFNAAIVMGENRLKANDLWKPEDQLLLEGWQAKAGNVRAQP